MTPIEISALLAMAAACDRRTVGDTDVAAMAQYVCPVPSITFRSGDIDILLLSERTLRIPDRRP